MQAAQCSSFPQTVCGLPLGRLSFLPAFQLLSGFSGAIFHLFPLSSLSFSFSFYFLLLLVRPKARCARTFATQLTGCLCFMDALQFEFQFEFEIKFQFEFEIMFEWQDKGVGVSVWLFVGWLAGC